MGVLAIVSNSLLSWLLFEFSWCTRKFIPYKITNLIFLIHQEIVIEILYMQERKGFGVLQSKRSSIGKRGRLKEEH